MVTLLSKSYTSFLSSIWACVCGLCEFSDASSVSFSYMMPLQRTRLSHGYTTEEVLRVILEFHLPMSLRMWVGWVLRRIICFIFIHDAPPKDRALSWLHYRASLTCYSWVSFPSELAYVGWVSSLMHHLFLFIHDAPPKDEALSWLYYWASLTCYSWVSFPSEPAYVGWVSSQMHHLFHLHTWCPSKGQGSLMVILLSQSYLCYSWVSFPSEPAYVGCVSSQMHHLFHLHTSCPSKGRDSLMFTLLSKSYVLFLSFISQWACVCGLGEFSDASSVSFSYMMPLQRTRLSHGYITGPVLPVLLFISIFQWACVCGLGEFSDASSVSSS